LRASLPIQTSYGVFYRGSSTLNRFILSRLGVAVALLAVVIVLSFLLLQIVPGDPVTALVGEFPAPQEYLDQIRQRYGLDLPVYVQLGRYLWNLLQGQLGFSFANQQPVLDLILHRGGNTLLLMIPALIFSTVLGIGLALLASRWPGGLPDTFVTSLSLVGYSIPVFWLGQVLIIVFAVNLGWLPAQGMLSLRGQLPGVFGTLLDFARHWILPAVCVITVYSGVVARVARASLREASGQDFVTTALAKGLSDREALRKHVLPNALIPVVSVIGNQFGHALTGTVLIEAVFAWPGLGGLFVSSIASRDYPVLLGIFLFATITVVLANLVTDLVYGLIDPRIRQTSFG
jgi:peptide/nickel transport system permease protein